MMSTFIEAKTNRFGYDQTEFFNPSFIKYVINLNGNAAFALVNDLIVSELRFDQIGKHLIPMGFRKIELIRESMRHNHIEKNGCPIDAFVNTNAIAYMYEKPYYGPEILFFDGEKIGSANSMFATLNQFKLDIKKHNNEL